MKIRINESTQMIMKVLLLIALVVTGINFGTQSSQAVGSFSNGDIANAAETYANGAWGDECKVFANNAVKTASGNTIIPTGYQQGFANAGGIEIAPNDAVRGDIIQITPGGSTDSTVDSLYDAGRKALHTAVILANNGGSNFSVIDSNWSNNHLVQRHSFNPYTWAGSKSYGGIVKIWRLGYVSGGTTTQPPANADTDADGTFDAADVRPTIPGPVNNRGIPNFESRVTGDFNGDGKSDIAAFYDFGGCGIQLFVFYGTGGGSFGSPSNVWSGSWCVGASKPMVGDFNGDGKSDIAAFYDSGNGNGTTQLFVFNGTSTGFTAPTSVWNSGAGNWYWQATLQVNGDFNGDGKQDIAAFYDFNGCSTQLFVFYGNGDGSFAPLSQVWGGAWCWGATKPVVGDFNGDGKSDIAALYDFGGSRTEIFVFNGTSTGFTAPTSVWNSGAGNWNWPSSTQLTGDFNGDGKSDIAALYDFGGCGTQVFIFYGSGNGTFASPSMKWGGSFCVGAAKPTVGDFNGDGKSDIAALYDFGGGNTSIFEFTGTSTGVNAPLNVWSSGAGMWYWSASSLP